MECIGLIERGDSSVSTSSLMIQACGRQKKRYLNRLTGAEKSVREFWCELEVHNFIILLFRNARLLACSFESLESLECKNLLIVTRLTSVPSSACSPSTCSAHLAVSSERSQIYDSTSLD